MLMYFKSLRGFRKLFKDHISKRSKKGLEDKMWCEHCTMCVWIWKLQYWYFCVYPSVQADSWGSEFGTMLELQHILHMPPRRVKTFFAGKLQKLTSKSKVHFQNQTVSHTPNKNHWTPHSCDEKKQLRLQSQHNFLFFPEKEPTCRFCPFATRRLWNVVKETASGITAWRYFFSFWQWRSHVQ